MNLVQLYSELEYLENLAFNAEEIGDDIALDIINDDIEKIEQQIEVALGDIHRDRV